MARVVAACVVGVVLCAAHVARSNPRPQTRITVWAAFGGTTYGAQAQVAGAMISEQREVDVAANGEVRVTGIAATALPASIQLRDLTEPGIAITEQQARTFWSTGLRPREYVALREFFGLDADPNVLGVTWRVYWDFGVALGEYRAGVKSKGAA